MKITVGKLKKIISEALEMKDEFGNVLPQLPSGFVEGARVRMVSRHNDEVVNYGVITHSSPATQEGGGEPALISVLVESGEEEPDHHGPDPDYDDYDDLDEPVDDDEEQEEWEMVLVTDENGNPMWEDARGGGECYIELVSPR